MNNRFPKTTKTLTKEWKLSSVLDLGWSSDGDTLQDLHNRNNGSFDIASCYYYDSSTKVYRNAEANSTIDPSRGYWIRKSTSETVSRSELITLTAFFSQLTHYDQTMKTANGFLYKIAREENTEDTYLVTVAHLIFDTPQSIESQIATLVKSDTRDTLTLYCYSRYYDVAVFKVTTLDKLNSLSGFNTYSNSIPEHVRVNYLDPNTGNTIKVSAKYFNIVQSPIELGAIGHKLIRGASGSAVTDIRGQLIGMVSSCKEDYDNMSLCIPAATIYNIISNYSSVSANGELNFDLTNRIYPGLVSQPLQPGHLLALPNKITSGELVTISDNRNLKPFDIVTHIKINNNWIAVGKDKNLSSIILENQSQTTFDLKVQQCKQSWRNAFGTLPRKILGRKATKIYYEYNDDSLVPIMYVDYPISANNGLKLTLNTTNIPFEPSVVREGMSAKILDTPDVTDQHYYSIMSIDYSKGEVILDRDVSKLNVSKLRIYLLSGNYYYHSTTIDDQILTDPVRNEISNFISLEIEKQDPSTSTLATGIIEIDQYTILVVSHLVRYWAFLVLSQLKSIPQGHQQIVWAKECERLTTILYQFLNTEFDGLSFNTNFNLFLFDRCLIYVYLKLIEFVDYQLIMLTSIFLLNWHNNIFTKVAEKAGSVYEESDYFDLINKVFSGNMKLNVTSTHKIYNNLLELGGILFDQNKKMKANPDLIKGFTTHNTDGYSREFRNMKSTISQLTPVVMDQDYNSKELELVYKELLNLNANDLKEDDLGSYYFKSYGLMQSFWDHANQNLGNIISAMDNADIYEEKVVKITTESMPPELDTWHFQRLLWAHKSGC